MSWEADPSKDLFADAAPALDGELHAADLEIDRSLRPKTLDDYLGQTRVKDALRVHISAARARKEPLDHVLFYGPPGLGKTTLANILAREMGAKIRITSGPAIARTGDLAAILTNLEPGEILFIDEIHRLNRSVEEVLYPAMEDFALDIVIGKGPAARSIRLDLPRFTLVGATTRTGLLTGPLRDRFGIVQHLDYYSVDELSEIILRSASLLGVDIDDAAVVELARRSRGTPRIANSNLKSVRDYAEVRADGHLTASVASEAFDFFAIDSLGLNVVDQAVLRVLCAQPGGRPMGLATLASAIGEDPSTLEDVNEPYLIKQQLIERTPSGRRALPAAYEHLGLTLPGF